jgi:hypothetical protein
LAADIPSVQLSQNDIDFPSGCLLPAPIFLVDCLVDCANIAIKRYAGKEEVVKVLVQYLEEYREM